MFHKQSSLLLGQFYLYIVAVILKIILYLCFSRYLLVEASPQLFPSYLKGFRAGVEGYYLIGR